jgi:hypothetical protein
MGITQARFEEAGHPRSAPSGKHSGKAQESDCGGGAGINFLLDKAAAQLIPVLGRLCRSLYSRMVMLIAGEKPFDPNSSISTTWRTV